MAKADERHDRLDEALLGKHIEARATFSRLLLANPRHFLDIFPVSGSRAFEEVTCLGLQPDQNALYATIQVKRATGYGGDLCSGPGGREYVRFFVDWNGDGDFTDPGDDVGVASVAVHDIPGPKPLSYTVSVALTKGQMRCFAARPRRVRAVLSYGAVPPAGDPNPPVVWGNVLDRSVQPKPGRLRLLDVIDLAKIKLQPEIAGLLDLSAVVGEAKSPPVAALVETYGKDVPLHRQLAKEFGAVAATMAADAHRVLDLGAVLGPADPGEALAKLDLGAVVGAFLDTSGDTTYEQLACVGLHPDLSGLVATFTQKRSSGYSGGLCSAGSPEFVTFWADWDNNGTFDSYLGTTAVRVHDEAVPQGGLAFSVFLPVSLEPHRRPCHTSPVARIRAVLSWNTPPSPTDPNLVPVWGNAMDALVQLPTGEPVVGQVPFISAVGGMAVAKVDGLGYASGTAVTAGFTADRSPFRGQVTIAGHIANAPDLSAGAANLRYLLRFRADGTGPYQAIDNAFDVALTRWSGSTFSQTVVGQSTDAAGTYAYLEDLVPNGPGGDQTFVEGSVLGKWSTAGLPDGRYELSLVVDPGGPDERVSNIVRVRLDNTGPHAEISLAGDPFVAQGTPVAGTLTATAPNGHFGSWSLGVLPGGYPHTPAVGAATTAQLAGQAFTLATAAPAVPGGYVLRLVATDRSIVNSGYVGAQAVDDVGFCVEAH